MNNGLGEGECHERSDERSWTSKGRRGWPAADFGEGFTRTACGSRDSTEVCTRDLVLNSSSVEDLGQANGDEGGHCRFR